MEGISWEITIQITNKECPFLDKFFGHDAICKHPNVRKGRVVCNYANCPLRSDRKPPWE